MPVTRGAERPPVRQRTGVEAADQGPPIQSRAEDILAPSPSEGRVPARWNSSSCCSAWPWSALLRAREEGRARARSPRRVGLLPRAAPALGCAGRRQGHPPPRRPSPAGPSAVAPPRPPQLAGGAARDHRRLAALRPPGAAAAAPRRARRRHRPPGSAPASRRPAPRLPTEPTFDLAAFLGKVNWEAVGQREALLGGGRPAGGARRRLLRPLVNRRRPGPAIRMAGAEFLFGLALVALSEPASPRSYRLTAVAHRRRHRHPLRHLLRRPRLLAPHPAWLTFLLLVLVTAAAVLLGHAGDRW